jgi:hypothetical protein
VLFRDLFVEEEVFRKPVGAVAELGVTPCDREFDELNRAKKVIKYAFYSPFVPSLPSFDWVGGFCHCHKGRVAVK